MCANKLKRPSNATPVGMASKVATVTQRAEEYLDLAVVVINVALCVPGSMTRAIKPGGVAQLCDSIRETGYKRVPLKYANAPPRHSLYFTNRSDR